MLGERGMWFKQTFYEWSVRVPLMIAAPEIRHGAWERMFHWSICCPRFSILLPTASPRSGRPARWPEPGGASCRAPSAARTGSGIRIQFRRRVCRFAHGAHGPLQVRLHAGIAADALRPRRDPDELDNLSGVPEMHAIEERLHARVLRGWNPDEMHARLCQPKATAVSADVARRSGRYPNRAYQPFVDESKRFIRGAGGAGPTAVKGKARFRLWNPHRLTRRPANEVARMGRVAWPFGPSRGGFYLSNPVEKLKLIQIFFKSDH